MVVATELGLAELDQILGEHREIVQRCRQPVSIAELSAYLDVPLGVARVLVTDLLQHGFVVVQRPAALHPVADEALLKKVIDGLRQV